MYLSTGSATILRLGGTTLRAKRAENFLGCTPTCAILGGTAATKRGIQRAYRTALLQYLISYWFCSCNFSQYLNTFFPRDALQCKAQYCDCMSSVHPSVTLVDQDHIGWKSWKLIARTISPIPSLFVVKRPSTYSQGNMGKFGED